MIKFFAYIICYLIYPISFLFPRKKKLWAFGSYRGAFNDNSKYLFIYASQYCENATCVWLSTSKQTTNYVRSLGLKSYYVASPQGIWYALRSAYWFVNSYTSDIIFCLSGGAKIVNLWHGIPIKCIEFCITKGELAKRYVQKDFWECFYHPASFIRPDYMVSTTDFYDEVFSKSFRISKEQCMHVGCPRNQMLLIPKEDVVLFIKKYESKETQQLISKLHTFDTIYVYMPTWRDSQRECFANGFDLDLFNECLKEQNAFAIMKPHANTIIDESKIFSNLIFLNGNVDMYTILPFTDVLITDYSSIMYDYILMPEKHILLYHYDFDEYISEREFIFPIDENLVGNRVYSFEELLQMLRNKSYSIDLQERKRIMAKFWGETMNYDVCQNIIKTLGLN